jgi:hypothetical protein
VRTALETLPWVEQNSLESDVPSRTETFAVKDKSQFNLEQLKKALQQQNYIRVELNSGPDAPSPSNKA